MAETQNQVNQGFELSYALSDEKARYSTAAEAGKAFAEATGELAPMVVEASDKGARTLASSRRNGDEHAKLAPPLELVKSDNGSETDLQFWKAYHDRIAEKDIAAQGQAREGTGQKSQAETPDLFDDAPVILKEPQEPQPAKEQSREGSEPGKEAPPVMTPVLDNAPEGTAEPAAPQPEKTGDERFAMPKSFEERFILTREANRQELFRSYDDKRPVISDRGDSLHTKNADRSTAMDMIELAAHRGWASMKVKGPEEFRREMWIEGTAQGIEVKGYRPNDKDRAETERRAELIGERVIERTDNGKASPGRQSDAAAQAESQAKGPSNVIQMIDYKKGLEGKVTDTGTAPYRDREGASATPYVALELADGRSHKLWGVGLPDMLDKHQLKVGDKATIYDDGQKSVTVTERDPKTGEERQKNTFRREWGARDVERSQDQARNGVEPVQKRDEPVIESAGSHEPKKEAANVATNPDAENGTKHQQEQQRHSDRLEERLNQKEAARDPQLRGAASTLALIEAEMRAAGVSDKDRATVREMASHELANGIRAGRQYDVQRIPNVSAKQQAAVKAISSKDVSKIIEQARVRGPASPDASSKHAGQSQEQPRERTQQQDRSRER
ncbi:LPD7 domain-containing protein [Leisingera sp. M658]|uniref:LPD7 domain-containing protein n=1 Tax=Leisingera sp. M658 TaxID=2867015 RepID=UPI0021A8272A|nr:LPD7 domain-containing protein [Leisingera sp. M658]UWQ77463.1 hypothetical protein K3724_23290 [Leisingera sp. M658]